MLPISKSILPVVNIQYCLQVYNMGMGLSNSAVPKTDGFPKNGNSWAVRA